MGAISFSIDRKLVTALRKALPLSVFIETGTFHGESLEAVSSEFLRSISIEASEELWRKASARFQHRDDMNTLCGDSVAVLEQLRTSFEHNPTLFWLDAHWCIADDAAGEASQCPLLAELRAIGKLRPDSVILIDDARLFLCVPPAPHDVSQWPSFSDILAELTRLAPDHELCVVNDVIAFYPSCAKAALENYARTHGADWLHAAQALAENQALRDTLEEKEKMIRDISIEAEKMRQSLEEKKTLIGHLSAKSTDCAKWLWQRVAPKGRTRSLAD